MSDQAVKVDDDAVREYGRQKLLERKAAQDGRRAAGRAARARVTSQPVGAGELFARDVQCSGCLVGRLPIILTSLVGTDRALCDACLQAQHPAAAATSDVAARFAARLDRTALRGQKDIRKALGISSWVRAVEDEPPEETERRRHQRMAKVLQDLTIRGGGAWDKAAVAAERFLREKHLLMVLSGPPQRGKSTSAGWLVWKTAGHYLERVRWEAMVSWSKDVAVLADRRWVIECSGVVALDEVCPVICGRTGDTSVSAGIVNDIVRARRARGLPTVLTTNSPQDTFVEAYGTAGEGLWARIDGGWVDCGGAR